MQKRSAPKSVPLELVNVSPVPASGPPAMLTVREFVALVEKQNAGHTLAAVAKASRVPYSTLYRHINSNFGLSPPNAEKLAKWSKRQTWTVHQISAGKTLGVNS